jgi:hypothetical protein
MRLQQFPVYREKPSKYAFLFSYYILFINQVFVMNFKKKYLRHYFALEYSQIFLKKLLPLVRCVRLRFSIQNIVCQISLQLLMIDTKKAQEIMNSYLLM